MFKLVESYPWMQDPTRRGMRCTIGFFETSRLFRLSRRSRLAGPHRSLFWIGDSTLRHNYGCLKTHVQWLGLKCEPGVRIQRMRSPRSSEHILGSRIRAIPSAAEGSYYPFVLAAPISTNQNRGRTKAPGDGTVIAGHGELVATSGLYKATRACR